MALIRFGKGEMLAGTALANPTNTYSYYLQAVSLADSTGADFGTSANPLFVTNSSAGSSQVVGNVASGVADSGNPVKTGGVASSPAPTAVTTGQRVNTWLSLNGGTIMAGPTQASADGIASTVAYIAGSGGSFYPLATASLLWDNAATAFDRARGDTTGAFTVAAPASGTDRSITATTTSQALMASNASRHGFYIKNDTTIVVWINIGATAVATAGGGNIQIAANGGYYESPASVTPSAAVNIIAASGTPAITAREF